MKDGVMEEVKRIFKPEFLNRIDETIVFRALNKEDMKKIVSLLSKTLVERCRKQMSISLSVKDSLKSYIVESAFDPKYGARPLRRKIQNVVEDKLAEEILSGKIKKGDCVDVSARNDEVRFTVKNKR